MSDEYRRVLNAWTLSALPADLGAVRVISARADYDRGWGGSDVTPGDDPELTIAVRYVDGAGAEGAYTLYGNEDNAIRMSELLSALFKLAESAG
jgi:hypothetical protein